MDKGVIQIIVILLFVGISVLSESLKKRNKQRTPQMPPRRREERPRPQVSQPDPDPVLDTQQHEPHEPAWWEAELRRLEREAEEEVSTDFEPTRTDRRSEETQIPQPLLPTFQPSMELRSLIRETPLALTRPLKKGIRLQTAGIQQTQPLLFQSRADWKQAILMAELLMPPIALRESASTQSAGSAPGSSSQP